MAARTHPEILRVWPAIRAALQDETGHPSKIVSGHRSLAQQSALYARYRAGRGGRAAPPGASAHNYGLAIDVLITPAGKDPWEWAFSFWGRRAYRTLHAIARRYGLEDITATAPDDPFHLQVPGWSRFAGVRRSRARA